MKRTIEIDDTLQERVDSAIADVKEFFLDYLKLQTPDKLPCISNDLDDSGAIHEIIDGSVPIYTKEITDTWYLHTPELEQAYKDAGIGNNPRENDGMSAIYCYIEARVHEWYSANGEQLFEEWQAKQTA